MRVPLLAWLLSSAVLLGQPYGLRSGALPLASATALAFGPDGILFVGDSAGGAVFALDTGDRTAPASAPPVSITGIDQKIAAFLGTAPSQVRFLDVKVNPISKNIYIAIARGRGPDAIPVLLRVQPDGSLAELDTRNIAFARASLPGLPEDGLLRRRASRMLAITDLQYASGQLIVAGLSNEDFSSTLRLLPFPFQTAGQGASVEIYHTSHFAYETEAPVRTMVPYARGGEQFLLAAYTCTPLVRLRVSDLQNGAKITGDTVAELGRHSSPLDMILYQRQGRDFLLVANTARGLLKLSLGDVSRYEAVTEEGGDALQIPMQAVAGYKSVVQLEIYDADRALLLLDQKDRLDLRLLPLP